MTITQARSLVPALEVVDADPADDLEGLRRLTLWAGRRYSPIVAPDPPQGIWLDISGCSTLFGGERALLKDLFRRVAESGLTVQLAVADTPGTAHAVARYVPSGRPVTVEPGQQRRAIALLPIAALRLDLSIIEALRRLGFERIEHLIDAPRGPLAKRFGRELHRRLDQALGNIPEPIEPMFPDEVPQAWRGLLEPISTADAIGQVIRDLVDDLVDQLTAQARGVRKLDLYLHRVDRQLQTIRVGTAVPTRDPAHLAKLLSAKTETVDPGLGIETMTLVAPLIEPLVQLQAEGLTTSYDQGPNLAPLVDALANRFGGRQLYRTRAIPSAMPERSIGYMPALGPRSENAWEDDLPRPSRMIVPPEPIEVTAMLPDHPPAMFGWRGRRYRVAAADGPERLHGEWWRSGGHEAEEPYAVRDYYQVETTDGGRYWLFRLGDGERVATGPMRWFIHGAFG